MSMPATGRREVILLHRLFIANMVWATPPADTSDVEKISAAKKRRRKCMCSAMR